jgi:hypothetical protein
MAFGVQTNWSVLFRIYSCISSFLTAGRSDRPLSLQDICEGGFCFSSLGSVKFIFRFFNLFYVMYKTVGKSQRPHRWKTGQSRRVVMGINFPDETCKDLLNTNSPGKIV